MIIKTLSLDNKHWSSEWIPISYQKKINNKQKNKSYTFLWSENNQVLAMVRSYYISNTHVEIGDVWLSEKYRGKVDKKGEKISFVFMKRVISKIWKIYPKVEKISLVVSIENIPAIKLYEKLKFKINKSNINIPEFGIKKGLSMIRMKKI